MAIERTKTGQTARLNQPSPITTAKNRRRDTPALLRSVLDHQETAAILTDEHLAVQYMNPAAEALTGTSLHFAVNGCIDQLFTDPALSTNEWQNVLTEEVPISKRGAVLVLKDSSRLLADYRVIPVLDRQTVLFELNTINRLMRIGRDDQSVNARETSRRLVRGLAHEVKNPLGGIRGAAQLLLRKLVDADLPGYSEYTQIIIDEADRLTQLVDNMLGPSEVPKLTATNIHEVIARVVQLIELDAQSTEGAVMPRVVRDFDPSLPEIQADEQQLVQAVLNIVRNAVQALANTDDPTLSIRTRIVRQFTIGAELHRLVLHLDIQDNGPGIPPDLQDRVFYPMISGRSNGTGLGLAITQTIVGQHGGMIELESRPGNTCFSIYLPFPNMEPAQPGSQP